MYSQNYFKETWILWIFKTTGACRFNLSTNDWPHFFSWITFFLWYLIWLFKYMLFKLLLFFFYKFAQKSNLLSYELRATFFSGWFKEKNADTWSGGCRSVGRPIVDITLSWVGAIASKQGINPVHPCRSLIVRSSWVWLWGLRQGKRGVKKEKSCMLNTGSETGEHCLELERMPICHTGDSLEG